MKWIWLMGICPSPYLHLLYIQLRRSLPACLAACNYLLIWPTELSSSNGRMMVEVDRRAPPELIIREDGHVSLEFIVLQCQRPL